MLENLVSREFDVLWEVAALASTAKSRQLFFKGFFEGGLQGDPPPPFTDGFCKHIFETLPTIVNVHLEDCCCGGVEAGGVFWTRLDKAYLSSNS